MARWGEFAEGAPAMAEMGRALMYQFGPGLGFIATVRKDGGPRMHPICPVITQDGLYTFILTRSPKGQDLLRDGRYALHSLPPKDADDEFYLTGRAEAIHDPRVEEAVDIAYRATGATHSPSEETLFELQIEHVMLAKYPGPPPAWPPEYTNWHAPKG
ncbi:MAG: pyridoxamine 5'-phosphate oxidase family protein [Dehalococcoidia bacterium]